MSSQPAPIESARPGDPIRYVVGQLTTIAERVDGDDMELGGLAVALGMIANDVDARAIEAERKALESRKAHRRLDRTRPTNWAYEQACKALEKHRERANGVTAERDCLALAVQFALSWDGAGTVHELHKGIREIVATMPAATKEG